MGQGWSLVTNMRTALELDAQVSGVRGEATPMLQINLHLQTVNERTQIEVHDLRGRLYFQQEYLGETRLAGEMVYSHGTSVLLELPTSHRLLGYVTDRLGNQDTLQLELGWSGILRFLWNPNETDLRIAGGPEPGVWTDCSIDEANHRQIFSIARSDWYSKVVSRVASASVVFAEVAVPVGPLGTVWTSTASRIEAAEKAYAMGDDAAVFNHLRGALDALPGAKVDIYADLPEPQRKYVDDLTKAIGAYLHAGRHVAELSGGDTGFPVDHIDARFAINVMRVLLAYASTALTSARPQIVVASFMFMGRVLSHYLI
jgi:hypothetical protein